jgi:tetratricopeptide (TPR) repeat protein
VFTSRAFHETTAHYNGYFNARELIKETIEGVELAFKDDYSDILPIYKIGGETEAKGMYPAMDKAILKCSTVIDRHSMKIEKKEKNDWIDDNYMTIGQAHFYKQAFKDAEEVFTYVAKTYKKAEIRYDASVWLARTYIAIENYSKAKSVLEFLAEEKKLPKHIPSEIHIQLADLNIKQGQWADAVAELQSAIAFEKDKKLRARLTFILAQVYQKQNKAQDAINAYAKVVKMNPDYEMSFYAQINQALAYNRKLDSKAIKSTLTKMLRDEKNKDFRDQIYYALADVEIKQGEEELGIEHLIASVKASTTNTKQKALSFLKLGDIYFETRDYKNAKNYYDSTAKYIPEDYPEYLAIKGKAESLTELVLHLDIIELEDSLQALALLPEKDKEKKILSMIAKMEAEQERKKLEEEAARALIQNAAPVANNNQVSGAGSNWYFYNSTTIGFGFTEFKKKWGVRTLEDNWRRKNKAQNADFANTSEDENTDAADGTTASTNNKKEKTLADYLAELPTGNKAIEASTNRIIKALYNAGLVYKERLYDEDNSIEAFRRIVDEYDTSSYAITATYQLYRIYLKKEQGSTFFGESTKDNSAFYKNIILTKYPTSEFAKLINDPDYATKESGKLFIEKEGYETTYSNYRQRMYADVLIACNSVIADQPFNTFLPKYYFVKALVVQEQRDAVNYEKTLKDIVDKYPETEEGKRAKELLDAFNKAKPKLTSEEAETGEGETESIVTPTPSAFEYTEASEHFFGFIFPTGSGNINDIKGTIANFNTEFYSANNLKITNSFINKDNQIVLVRSFPDKQKTMDYYTSFIINETILKEINESGFDSFIISTKNFSTLFKNKDLDGYFMFFNDNYFND